MKRGISIELDSGNPAGDRRFERMGFVLLGVLVIAAGAGLLGTGPLTRATQRVDDLKVSYPYIARMQESIEIDITLPSGTESLIVDRNLMAVLQVESISPEPEAVRLIADDTFQWDFREPETPGAMRVHIHARPRHGGLFRGSIKALNADPISLSLLIYP